MVPADSGRIPRVPPYSGARLACPWLPVRGCHPLRPAFPDGSGSHSQSLWPVLLPRARLDAPGLGSSRFARHYSGNRCFFLLLRVLRCFSSPGLPTSKGVTGLQPAGLPHSDMRGSFHACRSPRLFAACRVLPRRRKPRHPPSAIRNLLSCYFDFRLAFVKLLLKKDQSLLLLFFDLSVYLSSFQ